MEEKFKILIVEDELLVAKDIAARLSQHQYEITGIANSCEEAIRLFEQSIPDLVLLDITIKGNKDGIETAQELYKIQAIPFIYLTAHTDSDTLQRAKNTFPTAYLIKPFNTINLLASIELALHNFAYQRYPVNFLEQKNELIEDEFYTNQEYVFIKDGSKFMKTKASDIYYIESDDNYLKIYTQNRMIHIRSKFSEIIEKLNKKYIIRVHKSFCVNLNQIESFTDNEIDIRGIKIPVGRNYKDDFLKGFKLR